MGIWVIFTIIEIVLFAYNYTQDCYVIAGELSEDRMREIYFFTYKIFYWILIARDLSCLATMVIFQYRAASSQ